MQPKNRIVSGLTALAVTAILTVTSGLQTATASPAPTAPARAGVTSECAAAQTSLALARSAKATARHKVVKARKALRKAKHTHHRARIHKAKRVLKKARLRYAVRTHNERVQAARVGYACSSPSSSARATGTGLQLDLLGIATGAAGKVIDLGQLTTLLDSLLPGVSGQLDPGQLTALLNGFNAGAPTLDDATILLGSVFSPEELQALLSGSASPELVLALTEQIIGELSGLSGVPVPSTLDTSALEGIVSTVTGLLGGLLGVGGSTGGSTGGGTGGSTGVVCTLLPILC